MSGRWIRWAGAILMAPAMASAQVDLATLDRDMAGPRAQVLVLGSVHLSELPASFKPASLAPVIDRLAAFKPEIITIEALPGEECDMAARNAAIYGADYCASTDAAKQATGLDVPAAIAEVEKTLAQWPAKPTPAQRRHLASRFLAANDRASAYVQWLQLPAGERRAGDGLDEALVAMLRKLETRNDESYVIGARLAAQLGLPRLHAVDNHTGDNARIADVQAFGKALQAAWDSDRADLDAALRREKASIDSGDMLALYRVLNQPASLDARAKNNIVPAMRSTSPERYPQVWVAGWETRNLRMVANIRETFREKPGARVLSIVGSAHKPWFDTWLGQLQGVEIVDVGTVLK